MKKWISLLLVALMLMAIAPVAMADPEITEDSIITIVNCKNSANVREKATSDSKKLGEAPRGKTYQLLAVEGNWYKIQYKKDLTGYVYTKYGKVGKKGDAPLKDTATVTNAPDGVNIRAKASSSSKILGVAYNGDTFEVTGKSGKWSKIKYSGDTAWLFTSYLTKYKDDVDGKTATIVNVKYQVNIRAKASSSSKKLGTAVNGETFTAKGVSGRWVKVEYKGDTAYIYDKYVKIG